MSQSAQPNTQQAAQWNEASGRTWVELQSMLDRVLAPLEQIVVDAGYPGEGGHVLDIGCGAGATTLATARRVGTGGSCTGLDISRPLVTAAKARAEAEAVANARFIEGDAQTFELDLQRFDAVISRFGVMFFDDPTMAFGNIRRAARPGAKLAFIAWRSPAENDFMTAAARAAAPFLPEKPAPDPNAPGPFAFADGARVRMILEASGWSAIEFEQVDAPCEVDGPNLMAYVTRLGPVGAALREVDRDTAEKIVAVLPAAFEPFMRDGKAHFNAACWLVTARA
jgi:SAM-dependent methyltransferase